MAKRKVKSKIRKSNTRKNKYLNLFVSDGEDKIKLVKLKTKYSKYFIKEFGLESIPNLKDFIYFKEFLKYKEKNQ